MTLNFGRTALAASILAISGGMATVANANPVLEFTNLFGWVEGSQSCTDRTPTLTVGGGTCDGGPNDIITFSDNVAALGADAFATASWRNFDEPTDGLPADEPLSLLNVQGFSDTLAPGETKLISQFFNDNNVLSPFGEAFDWAMSLRNRFTLGVAAGPTLIDTGIGQPNGGREFDFTYVETLNFTDPADCPETFAPQVIGDRGCNDRYIGEDINELTASIPLGLIAPGLFTDPMANIEILVESEGELVVLRDLLSPTGDITVFTAEPEDSTLRFFIRYNAVPEPATLSLVGAGLLLTAGFAARRRRS